ncbi:MAG: T9SS type A sorting domain-containing protein [Ignavibacteriae bacterium]|nr:T9SS type A sorting domain-containing protein [Ignavibacteriota bacterium]
MKRFAIAFFALMPLLFLANICLAGVGGYSFGESAGTYTAITGSTLLIDPGHDDTLAAAAPIGFNFMYDGIAYTTFRASSEGWISFNTGMTSSILSNSLRSAGIILGPFWDDLDTEPIGTVHYVLEGSAPNRVLTVEYKDIARTGNTAPVLNFQVKLFETSNVIQFVYGSMNLGGATFSASIGIADMLATSTTANFYQGHIISVTPGAPATSSTLVENATINSVANLASGTTYTFTPPSTPISTNKTVGAAGDYATLQAAFAALRDNGISAPITLSMLNGFTLAATDSARIDHIPGTSATNTVTLRPDAGASIILTRAGATNNNFVFRLRGTSYVTIDGIGSPVAGPGGAEALELQYTGTTAGGGIIIQQGVQNCTIKRLTVKSSGSTTTTTNGAILFDIPNTTNNINIANNNNIVENCLLTANDPATVASRPMGGVTFNGSTTVLSNGCKIRNNVIRDWQQSTATNGAAINGQAGYSNVEISGNDMYFTVIFPTTTATALNGIYTNSTSMSIQAFNNKIHDISPSATATSPNTKAFRLLAFSTLIPSRIYNNFIYLDTAGVTSHTGTAGSLRGISVEGSGTVGVFYNSVRIGGNPASGNNGSSSCYYRSAAAIDSVINNNFHNARTNGDGTGKHYAISRTVTTGTLLSNYNNLRASGTGGNVGLDVATDRAALSDWQTATAQDANSFSETPNFLATSNLHIDPAIPTQLESGGTPIAGISADIDGNARNGTTPDIGADEFAGTAADLTAPVIAYTPLANTNTTGARTLTATITDASGVPTAGIGLPALYWRINGGSYVSAQATSLGSDQYQFSFGASAVLGDSVFYYICAQDNAGTPNVSASPSAGAGGLTANPPAASTPPTSPSAYKLLQAISGLFTVGTTGQYATLTAAINDLNGKYMTGPVTFELIDPSYGASETFPLIIEQNPGSSVTNTFTIKPSSTFTNPTVAPVISGSSTTAIIKLNGSDFVTIDGSTSGGTDRSLTIENTNNATGTAAIWLSSLGAGAGAMRNTVKNLNLFCGADQSTGALSTYGIIASGTTISTSSDGADNDTNTFSNNAITKVRYGIYLRGASGNSNDSNTVVGNLIGPTAFGVDEIGKAGITLEHQNAALVSQNVVRFVGGTFATLTSGTDRVGIGLGDDGWTPSATAITNSYVTRNLIHDIFEARTFSAVGIVVAGSGTPSSNTVANNMIYNVLANGTAGDQALGIGISAGDGDKVVFNSIRMEGNLDGQGGTTNASQSGSGIRISSTTPANLTLKNNIVSVDLTSTTTTINHYCIVAPSTSYAWGTGGLDYNNYYFNGSNTQMRIGGIGTSVPYTAIADLATWQTQFTPNQDVNSKSFSPDFTSATDLHLNVAAVNHNYDGTPIAGIATDFDGDSRVTPPYIGADEVTAFPLPVQLASFTARLNENGAGVRLDWRTISEINNYGFFVERKRVGEANFVDVANSFQPGYGTTNEPHDYSFVDATLTQTGLYSYRLRQVDNNGPIHHTDAITINVTTLTGVNESAPREFALKQNYPNPFNPETVIKFSVENTAKATIEIYNLLGQKVATLFDDVAEAGQYYKVRLNATSLASGMYIYRLQSGTRVDVKKMMLLK